MPVFQLDAPAHFCSNSGKGHGAWSMGNDAQYKALYSASAILGEILKR
jgi:hypothetical protein